MLAIIIYLIAGILWGTYALLQQKHIFGEKNKLICFTLNFLFWWGGMCVAIIRLNKNNGEKK
jgi:hypothetical protein